MTRTRPWRLPRPGARGRHAWRVAGSVVALGLVAATVDLGAVAGRLRGLDPRWAALACALAAPQVVLSAARWRFTAGRVARAHGAGRAPAPLSLTEATREYWLGTFLNQVLPGGVVGDVGRALRHAGGVRGGAVAPAARSVVYERASGQLALALVLCAGAAMGPAGGPALTASAWIAALLLTAFALLPLALPRPLRLELHAAFVADGALPRQLASSLAIVATYVLGFALAAAAVGAPLGPSQAMRVVPPILLAMALPISVAGWGVREGAAAAVYAAAGLDPGAGVAASATYGVVVLVGSLPGAVALAARPATDPPRRSSRGC